MGSRPVGQGGQAGLRREYTAWVGPGRLWRRHHYKPIKTVRYFSLVFLLGLSLMTS